MTRDRHEISRGRFAYRHSGVRIGCDFEIPEWRGFAEPDPNVTTDVRITLGEVEDGVIPSDAHGFYADGCLNLTEPDAGRWSICRGEKIVVDPQSASRMAEARLYTLGSAWGSLGYQRGWAMLHGSAVQIDGRSVLFSGAAEQGKSTLATALMERGARLLADDLSRVDPLSGNGSGSPQIHPSTTQVKLWDTAVDHFDWGKREMRRDHFRDNKFHFSLSDARIDPAPVPLSAIFVLDWGDEIVIERLRGGAAVTALAESTMYRKEYLELMGRLGEQIVHCAQIAAQIPVYRLTRPKGFLLLDEVCEQVALCLASPR